MDVQDINASLAKAVTDLIGDSVADGRSTKLVSEGVRLIKEVLAPAVVAAAQHAHDLAAGVEREGARLAEQNHIVDFAEEAVAFVAIALVAAGDEILPGGAAAARARNNVIESKLAGRHGLSAILASVTVAQQNVFARESTGLVRDAAIFQQADYRRHGDDGALRVEREAVLLLSARDALEHQHECAARAADVDWLIGSVQHQNRHLQNVRVDMRSWAVVGGQHYSFGDRLLLARVNHGFSQRHLFSPGLKRCLLQLDR
jgi:hypothetical protein